MQHLSESNIKHHSCALVRVGNANQHLMVVWRKGKFQTRVDPMNIDDEQHHVQIFISLQVNFRTIAESSNSLCL